MTPDQPTSAPNEAESANQQPTAPANPKTAPGTPPISTQGHMGDGAGQRGGYGDSDQTNGMEGGDQSAAGSADSKG
ncbi:hypothetical protein [Hymenobacter sp. B81]|uniref:hypothetical protein n=1 Tax=Hymenobacter sp. B81 TaxID=3344878 RepID=UPI0037DC77C1